MKNIVLKHVRTEWKRFLFASAGIMLYGIFINILAWQFRLVTGGFPGYALLFNYLTSFPVGQIVLVFNTMLFIITFLFFGKGMSARGVYGYTLLSLSIDISRQLMQLHPISTLPLMHQILYNGMFGVIGGLSISMAVFAGYNVGGYTILSLMINKLKKIPHENVFLIFDVILGLCTAFLFGWTAAVVLAANAIAFYFSWRYSMRLLRYFIKKI
jgi:uncharacterized membrane-anchored protein YitT (DUF2179 family)